MTQWTKKIRKWLPFTSDIVSLLQPIFDVNNVNSSS